MNEKYVVEYCSNCETENEFRWDVEEEGFKAYCPHCGAVLMLCDECVHREDAPWVCTTESTPERECARTIKMLAESEEHKMNYMEKIAEMLGVEIGEKFKVTRRDTVLSSEFYITDNGLYEQIRNQSPMLNSPVLKDLLIGERKMIKLPWKPKSGEKVYYVSVDGTVIDVCFTSKFARHLSLYKLGKLYRTYEEAEAHAEEDKQFWDEIRKELEE